MRAFFASYITSEGTRGVVTVLAASSCDAVITLLDAMPGVRRLSVRPC